MLGVHLIVQEMSRVHTRAGARQNAAELLWKNHFTLFISNKPKTVKAGGRPGPPGSDGPSRAAGGLQFWSGNTEENVLLLNVKHHM